MLGHEPIIALFLLIVLMIVGGVCAVFWMIMRLIGLVMRGVLRLLGIIVMPHRENGRICPRPLCRAANPIQARFCRRCGCELSSPIAYARPLRAA